MKVGFIGTGVMGNSLVKHLLEEGHEVSIYTRTASKATNLLEAGALWKDSPKLLAADAEVVFTMVGYPSDVEEIYFGEEGIIENAKEGAVLIDLTTSKPELARDIFKASLKRGVSSLDAPVSGGDVGARSGLLSIMVGGEEATFKQMQPLLDLFGGNIVHQGPAGAGQHTKMCNQIIIASNMMGVSEALIYALKAGLDPETVLLSISSGAAGSWSLSNLAPKMISRNFEPGFYIKHFIKDMRIAADEAEVMGLDLPALHLSLSLFESLAEKGYEDKGTQALIVQYEDNNFKEPKTV
ncbi:NAD(P)-dependent oxidoreductase [Planococcus salinarum]|uniref:NAD(P)-dependent oxidoreductase n=1 Tax=Planococcus salinarum TaxID=622695 RepID=UPI000E3D4CD0|nr:NAD(P)-dependent oxidoreductase [Planococcus salinarum]TAA72157.1 NAD(P)-dependent oxidoreductase [Planococcus salinarum]